MAFKFDDSYLGAAMAFGKKAKDAKAAGNEEEAQAMMANKASSMVGGALTAVNGVTGMLNTALQSAGIQDTSQYTNQIDTLGQAGNHNYYDYGQLARDMSNTDFSVNTDYDAIRGMGGKGVTKEKIGAVGSSTLNGAMTGLQVGGPWGALAGAVIGAGSSIGGILAGDAKARVQQGYLDANADRATNLAMLNFNAGLEDISDRRNRFNLVNYAAKGGKIEIKKENEGKFTAAAKRHNMTVQEFAKHVLAKKNADKYSATMRKRANFARNAAGWKHADGGPIDYSGIATTNNRPYNTDYISYIDTALRNGGLNDYQRAAVLANIIEESGGNPFAEGPGGFYGLLQWSGARYPKTQEKDIYKEIDNQVANILSTATNKTDRMSWTHGGKGSGYNSLSEAMDAYNGKNLADVMKGYTLGYVRPAAGINAYNNRLKVAEQLYNLEGFTQHAEGGDLNTSNMNIYNTHGGYFKPGLISIDAGGTHEQNPNGGVQMGVDSQGIPNLVEEGETVYDDYVFSDRLKPTAVELKKFNLPEKYAGKTFAEISDLLAEEAKTRPNDAISNNGLGVMLDRLIACQEAHKQAQEERAMKRELSKMSSEELVALGAQLQQMSDQQAMAQQGMQQYMPQMEAPMMQQMPVDDQSQMMMSEQQPMMANGGLLHVYKDGTSKLDKKKQKLFDSVTDALITEANNRDSNRSALTGLPHEEPLKDEYPLMDAAIMAAQPGGIATKVMAPSVYKGILGGVASGEGAQALVQGLVPEGNIFKQLKNNKAVFNRKVVDNIKKEEDLAAKYIKSHPSSADWVYYKNATTLEPGFYGGGLEGLEVDYPGITKYVTTNILNGYKDGGFKDTAKKVYNKAKDIDKKLHIGMLSTPTVTLPDGTEVGINTGGGVAELLVPPVGGAGALKQLRQLTKESKKTGKLIKEGLAFLKEQEESQKKATEIMKVLGDAEDAARVSGVKYESASQAAIKAKEKVNSLIKAGDYRQAAIEHEKYTKALEKLGTATEADLSAQSALLKAQSNADKVRSIKNIEPAADATGQLSLFDNAATYTMREPTRVAGKHPWGLTAGILGGIGAAGAGAVGASLMRNNDSEVPVATSLPVGSGVLYENADEDYAAGGHLYPWGSWLLPRRRTNYGGTSDIWPNTRITNPSVDVGQTGYGVVYAPISGNRVIKDAYLPNAAVGNYSGYAIPAPLVSSGARTTGLSQAQLPDVDVTMGDYQVPITLGPTYDYGAGLIQENPYRIGYGNYHVYRTNNAGQASTPVTTPETGPTAPRTAPVAGRGSAPASATTASTSTPAGRPSLGLPSVEPVTSEAIDTSARLRRKGLGLPDVDSIALEERMPGNLTYGIQPGEAPDTANLEGTRPHSVTRQNFGTLLPTMGRYAGAAGNALSALGIALQEPDKVHWNRIQPNYVAGNLDLQKMRYTPLDFMIAGNQMAANSAAMWRAMQNANLGPGAPASFLAKNYADNIAMGNNFNNTQLANDQRRAQTIGVNNQAENMMRNFDFRRNAMNTGIANQFAQYNNQLDMDETLRNIQFENDKYAALSHAISNSLADISNIGRENFVMNQINSNAALYYGVGANGWAYYKGYDGIDWKVDPNTGRKTPVVDKSEIPAQQQKCGGKLKK